MVLSEIDVCKHYISVQSCGKKALNSLISFQKEVYELNAREMKKKLLYLIPLKLDQAQNIF